MEKSQGSGIKKEKVVGEDGLTKKQRRALKVQERGEVPKAATNNSEDTSAKNTTQLMSEKEKRKLEWEKKLAEQKKKTPNEAPALSKAEMKAKRRTEQEAQRQVKEEKAPKKTDAIAKKPEPKIQTKIKNSLGSSVTPSKTPILPTHKKNNAQFVSHLYRETEKPLNAANIVIYKNIHPIFVRLGVQYKNKIILGSNARIRALLSATRQLIETLPTSPKHEFCRYVEQVLQTCVEYLNQCRPLAVSMVNALRYIKTHIQDVATSTNNNLTQMDESEKRKLLLEHIDTFVSDQIEKACEGICKTVIEKITDGAVILTYSNSSLIRQILLKAHRDKKKFEVIIVDGKPCLEGRNQLSHLTAAGIQCTYVHINAISHVMRSVSLVLLGAHALLTNGYVMSRIGTAQVALVAHSYNTPVLVCCETYKFSERVFTDSLVHNELDNSVSLRQKSCDTHNGECGKQLQELANEKNLTLQNLLYDVTPPDFVTAVVTEIAILPCTSVPVVLRVRF